MDTSSGPMTKEIFISCPSAFVNGRGSIVNATPLLLISAAAASRSGKLQPRWSIARRCVVASVPSRSGETSSQVPP